MVLYDIPFWMEDDHSVEAFKSKSKTLVYVSRLNWTTGGISLAAWKLIGPNLSELSGSIIRDPDRKKPMYMVSMNHYIEERVSHNQQIQNRPMPKPRQKQSTSNNKWAVTYMQAVKGFTAKQP